MKVDVSEMMRARNLAQKTVLQMVHHLEMMPAHDSETMTAVQMVGSWVVMKVQMKVDDSEMMRARNLAQKTVLQMVHHLEIRTAHDSETVTAVQMVGSWVVMKVQMKVDDSEMMRARSLAQKTVLQMAHHLEMMTAVQMVGSWVVMKVQMKVDDSEMMRARSLAQKTVSMRVGHLEMLRALGLDLKMVLASVDDLEI